MARAGLAIAALLLPALLCLGDSPGALVVLLAAAVAFALGWRQPFSDRVLRTRPGLRVAAILLGSAFVTAVLIGGNLRAEFGPIDDHEIVEFLGEDGRIGFGEVVDELLRHHEVGHPREPWVRYRPSYYTLRFLEMGLWGDDPQAWYAARLALFCASLVLAWQLCWRWLGAPAGSLLVLYAVSFPFMAAVWCSLGPAEIYAMFGTALHAAGIVATYRASRGRKRPTRAGAWASWAAIAIGALVAMGSKENFLLLMVTTWALTGWLWRRRKLDLPSIVGALIVTAYGALIAVIVLSLVASGGVDAYQREVSLGGSLQLLLEGSSRALGSPTAWVVGACGLGIATLLYRARGTARFPVLARASVRIGIAIAALCALDLSQHVFYHGSWPKASRYGFPGAMVPTAAIVCVAAFCASLPRVLGMRPVWHRAARALLAAGLAVAVVGAGDDFDRLRRKTAENVARSRQWTMRVDRVSERLRVEPDTGLVMVSYDAWDLELVVSLARYLRVRGLENPLYLRVEGEGPRGREPPGLPSRPKAPSPVMHHLSASGGAGFTPLSELRPGVRAFGVSFSGRVPAGLESLGRLPR